MAQGGGGDGDCSVPEQLRCPISLQLLEDPVSMPCCGHAFSRGSLRSHLATGSAAACCPMCRANLAWEHPTFDVELAPRNRTIASLVEAHLAQQLPASCLGPSASAPADGAGELAPAAQAAQPPAWKCSLTPVVTAGGTRLPVGRLRLGLDWPSFKGDVTLFIPVIDKSGSMGGQPFEQVKEALMHMLHQTLANRSVFTCIVPYASHADMLKVPRDGSAQTERWASMESTIRNMRASGGTNFRNAFRKIREVLFGDTRSGMVRAQAFEPGTREYEEQRRLGRQGLIVQGAPAFVKSVVIVFMTDGQDNSGADRRALVEALRSMLQDWTKDVVVHTVGFSKSHDFEFLDALRKVGRTEGLFRYADPRDGSDALCSKLSELSDMVLARSSLPMRVSGMPFTVWSREGSRDSQDQSLTMPMQDGRGFVDLFVELPGGDPQERASVDVAVPAAAGQLDDQGDEEGQLCCAVPVHVDTGDASAAEDALTQWNGFLADEVACEALSLAGDRSGAAHMSVASRLRCAFLLQRARCLELHVKGERGAATAARLAHCSEQLAAMLQGAAVNAARLRDAGSAKPPRAGPDSAGDPRQASARDAPASTPPPCKTFELPPRNATATAVNLKRRGRVLQARRDASELHQAILLGSLAQIRDALKAAGEAWDPAWDVDSEGDSALAYAATIGRRNALGVLLEQPKVRATCLSLANQAGHTPLELAALRGHWMTVEDLLDAGATLGRDSNPRRAESLVAELLRRCYYNTAGRLVAAGLGAVTPEALQGRVPPETLEWVMLKIAGGNAEGDDEKCFALLRRAVENNMGDVVAKLLVRPGVRSVLAKDMHDFLLACGQNDGSGGPRLAEQLIDACKEEELALGSSIHAAAQAGWVGLLALLLRRRPEDRDWREPSSGASALGAACALRRAECIFMLLNAGADAQLPDKEGSTPLMHSCRRNHCAAVAALLGAGASVLRRPGQAGGSALVLCCTLGRPEILEMLLAGCERSDGRAMLQAEVAQLGCLHLAAEHDQASCIRVLLQHGVDAQQRAPGTGQTALHTAASRGCHASATALLDSAAAAGCPDADATDAAGRTPLHVAVKHGQVLLVRLLRCSGAETQAKDASGRVPAAYCCGVPGDVAAAIRAELLDPAQPVLLQAARQEDEQSCSALKYAGLPGYLSGRRCVDVHAGDGWTPLMEAVVCGNLAFARALARCGAELHRRDRRGLSALFWARALHGQDAAASLSAAGRPQGSAAAAVDVASPGTVQCKDGVLQVSAAALKWMEANFPAAAAAAVPCATLAMTLRAQGLSCEERGAAEGAGAAAATAPSSPEELLDGAGAAAFARLREAARRDVRDAMILEMGSLSASSVQRAEEPAPMGIPVGVPPLHASLRWRMEADSAGSRLLAEEQACRPPAQTQASASFSVVDFLQSLAGDEARWPVGVRFDMPRLLASSRVAAIGTVAAATEAAEGGDAAPCRLGLQQAFLLHAFMSSSLRIGVNRALLTGEDAGFWGPLAAALREAMEQLPPSQDEMFRLVQGAANAPQPSEGSILAWSGFASAATSWPSLLPEDQESLRHRMATGLCGRVLYRIRPRQGARTLSLFSPVPGSGEAVLLPQTPFKVVRVGSFPVPASAEALLQQPPSPTAAEAGEAEAASEEKMTVVMLEELAL